MDDEELRKLWQATDTRISTINDRTKAHTIQIKRLEEEIKKIKEIIH